MICSLRFPFLNFLFCAVSDQNDRRIAEEQESWNGHAEKAERPGVGTTGRAGTTKMTVVVAAPVYRRNNALCVNWNVERNCGAYNLLIIFRGFFFFGRALLI